MSTKVKVSKERTPEQKAKLIADADKAMERMNAAKTPAAKKAAAKKAAAPTKKVATKKAAPAKKEPAAKKAAAKKSDKPRNTSGVENPVQLIWDTCASELQKARKDGRELSRKDVWAVLEPQGVNPNTFARQWQEWKSSVWPSSEPSCPRPPVQRRAWPEKYRPGFYFTLTMKPNTQPTEPVERRSTTIQVHSIFKTIQGEGPFAGMPAIFLRLAGCNIQCPWCDTDYTSSREVLSVGEVADRIDVLIGDDRVNLVVITGGEPFRQSLGPLAEELVSRGLGVQVETNGTLFDPDVDYELMTVVCSPKGARIHPSLVHHLSAIKIVVSADDWDAEKGLARRPQGLPSHHLGHKHQLREIPSRVKVYVQPLDTQDPEENRRHTQAAVQIALAYGYTFCLQVHKYAELP